MIAFPVQPSITLCILLLLFNHLIDLLSHRRYYIEPDGALGFSQARSLFIPTGSVFGVTAYANGGFTYNGAPWTACPINGEGEDQRWQVFAQLPGLFFPATCIPFEALVVPNTSGRPGAWQYT